MVLLSGLRYPVPFGWGSSFIAKPEQSGYISHSFQLIF
ncbi:MAG: hypothetical protein ACI81W_002277, partial [Saprospiraceae bacterium]